MNVEGLNFIEQLRNLQNNQKYDTFFNNERKSKGGWYSHNDCA